MVRYYLVVVLEQLVRERDGERILFTCYQASLPPINIFPLIKQLQKLVKAMDFSGASYPRERLGKEAGEGNGCG